VIVSVRTWTPQDIAAVRTVLLDTWLDAYGSFIPESDLRGYLDQQYSESKLQELQQDPDVTGLVAEVDDTMAGYAKLYHERNANRFYVHQLYIHPKHQGSGVGRRLMIRAADLAGEQGFDRVWLGVMVKNTSAVQWYRAMGFEVEETSPFQMGSTSVEHFIGWVPLRGIYAVPKRRLANVPNDRPLAQRMASLLESQRKQWQMLTDGVASLDQVTVKQLDCTGFRAFLQWNPKRIVSTGAKVDTKTIQKRRCFLCVDNLPDAQQGIAYGDDYIILCNPAPIFRQHFTIPHIRHVPQLLEPNVGMMIRLAQDLSRSLTVFYNGPQCGASAPDHMHFQASPFRGIPVERDIDLGHLELKQYATEGVRVGVPAAYGREIVVLRSNDAPLMEDAIRRLMVAMRIELKTEGEPLVNVICSHGDEGFRTIFFLRRSHRPSHYFREGDEQILISPAAVDIGGLVVTPHERDFNRVDAPTLEAIYREVSLDRSDTLRIVDRFLSSS